MPIPITRIVLASDPPVGALSMSMSDTAPLLVVDRKEGNTGVVVCARTEIPWDSSLI